MLDWQKTLEIAAAICGACSFAIIQSDATVATKKTVLSIMVGVSFGAFVAPWICTINGWRTGEAHTAVSYFGGLLGMPSAKAVLHWAENGLASLLNSLASRFIQNGNGSNSNSKGNDNGQSAPKPD